MKDRRIVLTLRWNKVRFQVLHAGEQGCSWWRIVARNGLILAHSESFSRLWNARRSMTSIMRGLGYYAGDVEATEPEELPIPEAAASPPPPPAFPSA